MASKRVRSRKVFYADFKKEALDYLMTFIQGGRWVAYAQHQAGMRFPEFRSLTNPQIRYLVKQHRAWLANYASVVLKGNRGGELAPASLDLNVVYYARKMLEVVKGQDPKLIQQSLEVLKLFFCRGW